MKILITGVRGQLGCELVRILHDGQSEIGSIPDAYNHAEVVGTDVADLDITDAQAVDAFIKNGSFDLVINCAAMTNVDACEDHEDAAYQVNALGPRNLAQACQETGAKLVHVSTDYVFDGTTPKERIEDDTPDPRSAYGRTKLAGEQLVQKACKQSFIVRTAWLYGYVGKNFVKTMIRLAKEHGAIKVVDDQRGNPTSANDLAYEILQLAATDQYGIYHCTNKGICSWYDFACAIVDGAKIPCTKTPCTSGDLNRAAQRPAYSALRNKHLEDTIGDSMRPWQDALAMYLQRYNDQARDTPQA